MRKVFALSACVFGMSLLAMPAVAQDIGNITLRMEAQKAVNWGKIEDLRSIIDGKPSFSTLTDATFDMPMIDALLCDAVYAKQARVEVIELLLDLGADPARSCLPGSTLANLRPFDKAFQTAMLTAPRYAGSDSILGPPIWPETRVEKSVYLDIAEILMDEVAEPKLDGLLYIYAATDSDIAGWLLDRGADADAMSVNNYTTRDMLDQYIDILEARLTMFKSAGAQP